MPASVRRRGQSLEAGRVLGERYVITGFIGAGGMGAVYAAKHLRTDRLLAVKVLLPEFAVREDLMQRFAAEARAAGALNHPGIVEVVDLDREGDWPFIVMERLEGEELQARVQRETLAPALVARIGADIADAISCAHLNTPKIVHRDLKPQNIFLARKGRQHDVVKILDFGIAKLIESGTMADSLTRSGEIYGTPLYMSPEQLRNSKHVDERADIYSIGVILFHALTGVTPFRGDSFPDLVVSISTGTPPAVRTLRPEVPAGLAAVVERAMARDANDRYASAVDLRNALLPFAGETPAGPPVARPSRRGLLSAVAIAGGLASVAAGIAVSRRPAPIPPAVVRPLETPAAPGPAPARPDAALVPGAAAIPPVAPALIPAPAAAPAARTRATRKNKPAATDDLPALRPR